MSDIIGDLVEHRYRIEKKIGGGSFGTVYKALDERMGRHVAIKILTRLGGGEAAKARFASEIRRMARFSHPNILTVLDCGEFDDRPYLVSELVEGPSLAELTDIQPISPSRAVGLGIQICRAMEYIHARETIHMDLTLKNIVINERDEVKVLDFGVARLVRKEADTTSDIVGTPYYIAAEVLEGGAIDYRVDIFAFGVCLFRMLNGRFPFEGEHPTHIMYQIVSETDVKFVDGIAPGLVEVIRKCLSKMPEQRYPSFADVRRDLESVSSSLRPAAPAGPVVAAHYPKKSRRNPYVNRVMIKNPGDFFGRSKEVAKAYSRLDAPQPQSISVVGERRIGKSSLLNYLYQETNRKQHMRNYHTSTFVYLDLQRSVDLTVPRLVEIILSLLSYEEKHRFDEWDGERSLDQLKEVAQRMDGSGRRLIILMDEFEAVTKNKNFYVQFFSFLRFLANSFKVAYVTSSASDLQYLCYNKSIADSPFFNIFSTLHLRPLSRDEAIDLITVPSFREGLYFERHADRILNLAGCFPLYLQIACSALFDATVECDDREPDWRQIEQAYRDEVLPHYRFAWEKMDSASRQILLRVAKGKKIDRSLKHVCEDLVRRGYVHEGEGGMAVFASTFRDFILGQPGNVSGIRSFLGRLRGN